MKTDHIPFMETPGLPEVSLRFVPAPPVGAYVFTRDELDDVLRETCRMAREYWNVHGLDTERGASAAASEMLARLERERER